jgi:glutamate carboxypeptidase
MQHFGSLQSFLEQQLPTSLDLLRRMVEINSFTANKDGVNRLGAFTAQTFAPLGFSSRTIPSINREYGDHLVLTRKGKTDRTIALVSHLDTVFPPEEEVRNNFHWQLEGDRIFGPGTQDIKGGTVMMWLVLSALKTQTPDLFEAVTWKLLWNSSEERYSPDFGDVCRAECDSKCLAALVFETEGRLGKERLMVVARKGRATWRITVSGRGSHAGGKHQHGANAIVQLGLTVQRVAELSNYSRDVTFNVSSISGGTVFNRVPHEAIAEGEFRAFAPEIYERAKADLLALAGEGRVRSVADGFPCQVHVEILNESRPWPRNPATDSLFALWQDAAEQLSIPIGMQERGGLSDGNLIWDAVPTLDGLGPWGDNDHCSERSADGSKLPEYVEISSFIPKALLNVIALTKLIKTSIG